MLLMLLCDVLLKALQLGGMLGITRLKGLLRLQGHPLKLSLLRVQHLAGVLGETLQFIFLGLQGLGLLGRQGVQLLLQSVEFALGLGRKTLSLGLTLGQQPG
jgi:hypothetical protein